MRRRNRKRSSKAASPSKVPSNAENLVSSLSVAIETDQLTSFPSISDAIDLTSSLEFISEAENLVSSPNIAHDEEQLATSPNISSGAENPVPAIAPSGADRRTHPRYEFTATAEVLAAESGARVAMRVRDVSQQGCYVDTENALPLGTVTDVRIKKGAQLFEAQARVVYSRATKGMGLMFTAIDPERLRILKAWLDESRETSWLAANRRRSQRVLVTVPVGVSGQIGAGLPFEEETHTRAISAHGALIVLSAQVYRGQRLTLSNIQTKAALECVVAHIDRRQKDQPQVGVEFALPNPMFWHVAFPPKDWTPRHPHAKSPLK